MERPSLESLADPSSAQYRPLRKRTAARTAARTAPQTSPDQPVTSSLEINAEQVGAQKGRSQGHPSEEFPTGLLLLFTNRYFLGALHVNYSLQALSLAGIFTTSPSAH